MSIITMHWVCDNEAKTRYNILNMVHYNASLNEMNQRLAKFLENAAIVDPDEMTDEENMRWLEEIRKNSGYVIVAHGIGDLALQWVLFAKHGVGGAHATYEKDFGGDYNYTVSYNVDEGFKIKIDVYGGVLFEGDFEEFLAWI